MSELAVKRERLLDLIRSFQTCVVAMSAGVDSSVVAKAAHLALGDQAKAVTAVSPSLAQGELEQARLLAAEIGIAHEVLETQEYKQPDYIRNAPDRCYHCKSELYGRLEELADRFDDAVVINGVNLDDHNDYRPGMRAAIENRVRCPLAECGITKQEVRELAREWELVVWDKPASPCLASRVAYGEEVTPERLAMIDQAEQLLRSCGLKLVRVRYHHGDVARIEVPVEALPDLCEGTLRDRLVTEFKGLGFKYVTLDLVGFRSGSMNEVLPLAQIGLPQA